jgi:hypothetical protein
MIIEQFSWWNIVPSLVGGLMSAASAVGMFYLAQRTERKKREAEGRRKSAQAAFEGFWKLRAIAAGQINLNREITDQYIEARLSGAEDLLPANKVLGLLGAPNGYEHLAASEYLFLINQRKAELIAEIDLVVRRAMNNEVSTQKYNELRIDFEEFIVKNADLVVPHTGTRASVELKGIAGSIADIKISRLNNLLGQIEEHLDEDCKNSKKVVEDFLMAARAEFGEDFPKFKFKWE